MILPTQVVQTFLAAVLVGVDEPLLFIDGSNQYSHLGVRGRRRSRR